MNYVTNNHLEVISEKKVVEEVCVELYIRTQISMGEKGKNEDISTTGVNIYEHGYHKDWKILIFIQKYFIHIHMYNINYYLKIASFLAGQR